MLPFFIAGLLFICASLRVVVPERHVELIPSDLRQKAAFISQLIASQTAPLNCARRRIANVNILFTMTVPSPQVHVLFWAGTPGS
jgi:hypothetical protein